MGDKDISFQINWARLDESDWYYHEVKGLFSRQLSLATKTSSDILD